MREQKPPVPTQEELDRSQFVNFTLARVVFQFRKLASLGNEKYKVDLSLDTNETVSTFRVGSNLVEVAYVAGAYTISVNGTEVGSGIVSGSAPSDTDVIFSILEPHL